MPAPTASRSAPTAMCGSPKFEISKIGRITPDGAITEFGDGITFGARPLSIVVRDGALWFSEAAGNRIGRITVDGKVTEFPIPSHDSQPRAMAAHPDGSRSGSSRPRPTRSAASTATAASPSTRCRRRSRRCAASPSAPTATSGTPPTPSTRSAAWRPTAACAASTTSRRRNSGARCITAFADGRLFFTQYDAGLIGEVVVG